MKSNIYPNTFLISIALILALINVGCASKKISEYKELSEVGTSYSTTISKTLAKSIEASIDISSIALRNSKVENQTERKESITNSTNSIKKIIKCYNALGDHVRAMKDYFAALYALASTTAPTDVSKNAKVVADQIVLLGNTLTEVDPLIKAGASATSESNIKIIVEMVQYKMLKDELEARALTIYNQLNLQHEALKVIQIKLYYDIKGHIDTINNTVVINPYINKKIGPEWDKTRKKIILADEQIKNVEMLANFALRLKEGYKSLVNGSYSKESMVTLKDNLDTFLVSIENIEKTMQ